MRGIGSPSRVTRQRVLHCFKRSLCATPNAVLVPTTKPRSRKRTSFESVCACDDDITSPDRFASPSFCPWGRNARAADTTGNAARRDGRSRVLVCQKWSASAPHACSPSRLKGGAHRYLSLAEPTRRQTGDPSARFLPYRFDISIASPIGVRTYRSRLHPPAR